MTNATRDDLDRHEKRQNDKFEKHEQSNKEDFKQLYTAVYGDGSDDNRGLMTRMSAQEGFQKRQVSRMNVLIGIIGTVFATGVVSLGGMLFNLLRGQ